MPALAPFRLWCGPVQSVCVCGIGQYVAIQYVGKDALAVVGEFPVCGLFGLRVVDGRQADAVIVRVGPLPVRLLLPPVGQRVGLRLAGLVNEQEIRSGWRRQVDVVP